MSDIYDWVVGDCCDNTINYAIKIAYSVTCYF